MKRKKKIRRAYVIFYVKNSYIKIMNIYLLN